MTPPRQVAIAGASGLIGRALVPFLLAQGHSVVRLVRRRPAGDDELFWDPAAGEIDAAAIEGVDAIINLSGENIGAGCWTTRRREAILRSRVDATRTLVSAIQRLRRKPEVLLSGSAVGFYGERGEEVLGETSEIGHGFLPEVCLVWETHAEGATRSGVRVALLRFGVVLTPAGGALRKLLSVFRVGLGGRLGDGRQWMSWISIADVVGAIHHAMIDERCRGPLNLVAPQPVTNAEFAATLGRVLRRPAAVPVPAAVLRGLFGEMAGATLLASTRVGPERLEKTGYTFRHPTLEAALCHVLGRRQL